MGCEFCESLANSVGTLVADYVVKPVGRQLDYVRHFHDNVEKLVEKKGELVRARTRLQRETEVAERQLLHVEDDVGDLQRKAVEILSNVETLEMEIQQNKRCLNWCPNWSWRYQLSKQAMKKTLDISELLEKINKFGQPGRVGYRAPSTLPTIEFLCSKEFVVSEASKIAFHQIIEALQDDNISMIGLGGMGGVGKTTLVRNVGGEVKGFDRVIMVTVSETLDIEKMQNKIADDIDLNFEKKTGEVKAAELWSRLSNGKFLVILDDLWKEWNDDGDLRKIGIPLVKDEKGCKIILTTRNYNVCQHMECEETVQVKVLEDDEAWTLFEMNAGLKKADSRVIGEAKKIVKECKGLPLAIVTLARALKSKGPNS